MFKLTRQPKRLGRQDTDTDNLFHTGQTEHRVMKWPSHIALEYAMQRSNKEVEILKQHGAVKVIMKDGQYV